MGSILLPQPHFLPFPSSAKSLFSALHKPWGPSFISLTPHSIDKGTKSVILSKKQNFCWSFLGHYQKVTFLHKTENNLQLHISHASPWKPFGNDHTGDFSVVCLLHLEPSLWPSCYFTQRKRLSVISSPSLSKGNLSQDTKTLLPRWQNLHTRKSFL